MRHQFGKIGIVLCAVVGVALVGTAPAFGESKPNTNFAKLKPIKAPSPCQNDPGVTNTEIKVGAIVPLSGDGARIAPVLDGFMARIAKANADHEFGNRKVTVVKFDDKNDNALNASGAQSLVENDKVFAVFEGTGGADSSARYLYDQHVPVVGWSIGLPSWGTYPNMFSTPSSGSPSPAFFNNVYAAILKKAGATKIALVTTNTSATVVNVNQASAGIDKTKGIKTVYKTTDVPLGTTDWGSVAQQVKSSGANGLYFAGSPLDAAALASAIKQAGYEMPVKLFGGGYDPRVTGIPGFENAYTNNEWISLESNPPEAADFKKWLEQTVPGSVPNLLTVPGWIAGDTFIQGIKDAGVDCPTRKAFINNLRLEKAFTAGGWFAPVDLATAFGKQQNCFYISQNLNKAWTPAFGGQQVCATKTIKNNKVVPQSTATTAAPSATTAAK